jgi:hypothetical protein
MSGKTARPFFSYYGSKWTGAKHYGPPRSNLVIEPFAGSACYATRWSCENVRLYDVSEDICDLWDFLINCSESDITSIPDSFEGMEQVSKLSRGQSLLVRFWIAKGRADPSGTLSPWYLKWRSSTDCRVWGRSVKKRVVEQKPMISKWSIDCMSWEKIPLIEAHWHVDPPYNNSAGSRYPNSSINFESLGEWCRALPGHVDVCEKVGAEWLDFVPLYEVVSPRGS